MIKKLRGMQDIFDEDSNIFGYVRKSIYKTSNIYGYNEIITPILEYTSLFIRGIGDNTDIVNKEIYKFNDRKGRDIVLRPEGTSSVVRCVIENKLYVNPLPLKYFYFGQMFRYERPQKGRQRQFYQYGAELIGADNLSSDIEMIDLSIKILENLNINSFSLNINYLGDEEERAMYCKALKKYFKDEITNLCMHCQKRFKINILRILDCKIDKKNKSVINAPKIIDQLTIKSQKRFQEITNFLIKRNINVIINNNIVRGLDYYSGVVFELLDNNGVTIIGGGRYNSLYKELDGPDLPAIGFSIGIERLCSYFQKENPKWKSCSNLIYICSLMDNNNIYEVTNKLVNHGLQFYIENNQYSLKKYIKKALYKKSKYMIIISEKESKDNCVILKNLETSTQSVIKINDINDSLFINISD